eukprot:TRINITY_DN6422_c0_g2_i1.p1 TRINITY_DN6422_c0_g2~~TRINITY_DN6422_c0_g2_i1.p1  ORF type:complete len:151 (-),score=25.34 TRINITY_DN6422_c0_g2_i1:328-780(-)
MGCVILFTTVMASCHADSIRFKRALPAKYAALVLTRIAIGVGTICLAGGRWDDSVDSAWELAIVTCSISAAWYLFNTTVRWYAVSQSILLVTPPPHEHDEPPAVTDDNPPVAEVVVEGNALALVSGDDQKLGGDSQPDPNKDEELMVATL